MEHINVRMPPKVKSDVIKLANNDGRSGSNYILKLITNHLEKLAKTGQIK